MLLYTYFPPPFFFWGGQITLQPRLVLNSLCNPSCPQTLDPHALVSQVLKLQISATLPDLTFFLHYWTLEELVLVLEQGTERLCEEGESSITAEKEVSQPSLLPCDFLETPGFKFHVSLSFTTSHSFGLPSLLLPITSATTLRTWTDQVFPFCQPSRSQGRSVENMKLEFPFLPSTAQWRWLRIKPELWNKA